MSTTIPDLMNAYNEARRGLWAGFCLNEMPYPIRDLRDKPWIESGGEIYVVEDSDGTFDDVYNNAEYGGEINGSSMWKAGGFLMVVVYNNGPLEAWLLTIDSKVEE